MNRLVVLGMGSLLLGTVTVFGALNFTAPAIAQSDGWITVVDGKEVGEWDKLGVANWRIADGALVADSKEGKDPTYIITKKSYKDFQIKAEFWADEEANSGIFIRCSDIKKVDSDTCYEVNIFDKRPKPEYGTGAIVDVGKVDPMPKAAGKWNTYDITAQGSHLVVIFNGVKTVDANNSRLTEGPFALQYASGVIKFRKVQIKPL
ncbi:3-keto-disaccharide hydrolase [Bradyrhizobium prioriisuperbiae]|uniref:3-keto-disaccharide hydrolase n=1 Tax=Bradyrhizobium prioriisuperbiae TaxID=2854389 RepID=UPI003898FFA6